MTRDLCRQYLEDPEGNRAHLADCASCRAVSEELEAKVQARSVRVETLPLAPWEGARYRSWPLVAGGALTVLAVAMAFFAAAGVSPAVAFSDALRAAVPPADIVASLLRLAGGVVQNAPGAWQIGLALAFVAVNAVLIALLRRSPRGIDA